MATKFVDLDTKCKKTVEHFKKDASRMRGGRASSSLVEGLHVEYYGSRVPMQQVGLVSVPEPRLITIQVYDPGAVEGVEKAILQSDLGLSPSRDGQLIRLNIPALTEQRRKEFIKIVHTRLEEEKIALRNHRREAIETLKKQQKAKEVSEDDVRRGEQEIQQITDSYVAQLQKIAEQKEKEILEA